MKGFLFLLATLVAMVVCAFFVMKLTIPDHMVDFAEKFSVPKVWSLIIAIVSFFASIKLLMKWVSLIKSR